MRSLLDKIFDILYHSLVLLLMIDTHDFIAPIFAHSHPEIAEDCPSVTQVFFNDRCFWKLYKEMKFQEAHVSCQIHGGILTDVPDEETDQMLSWYFGYDYWIGINDIYNENQFVDMRNRSIVYKNWNVEYKQPNNWIRLYDNTWIKGADCVTKHGSGWFDDPCTFEYKAICSKEIAYPVPSTTTTSTRPVYSTSASLSTMNSVPSTTTTSSTTDTVPSTTKTSSTTGVSTSVLQSTTDTVPSTTTTSTRTVGSTSVSTSTTDSVPSTQTTSSTTGSSTSVSTSPSTTLSTAVSSKLASTSATYSVPSTTTSSLKTASSTLVSLSLSTSTPKSSSTVKSSSTDTFTSAHVSSSMSTTNLMKSTTASSVNKGCMCPCERMKNQVIITDKKVLISKIAKMKKELKVNKADLNKQLRKRLSVFDKRASAVAVGTIFGPLLIAFFIGIIVISDIPIMMRHLKYGLCRKAGKKKRKRRIRSDDVRGCPVDVQKDKAGIQEQEMVDNPA